MNAASGTFIVPLRLIGAAADGRVAAQRERAAVDVGVTAWATPPPPTISHRLVIVAMLVTIALYAGFVVAANTVLRV